MQRPPNAEASTSTSHLHVPHKHPRSRAGSVATARTTRSARSVTPLLPETLRQHSFPLPDSELGNGGSRRVEGKHEGAGSLRRVFIGPHFVGQSKGKQREGMEAMEDDQGSSSSSPSGSDDDDDEQNMEGRAERLRHRVARARRRGQRLPTGETVHGGFKMTGSRKSSMHKWTGGSFEVGGDIREAQARRDEAAKRKASAAASSQRGSLANTQTFVTAKTKLDGTKEDYAFKQPTPAVEATLPPSLVHGLLRRPSDLPIADTASLSAAPLPQNDTPTAPKGILRTKGALLNGSILGRGHPGSPSIAPPASLRSLPLLSPPPITGHALKSTPPSGTVKFSQYLPEPLEGDQPPAPASEVLARPNPVDETPPLNGGLSPRRKLKRGRDEILRKERMLMRIDWTQREDLPDHFDEKTSRKFPIKHEGWEEYGVVWRRHHIELWTEPAIHATSFILGRKKLKHIIPLHPNRTNLSLYSSADSIFCLTHRPSSSHSHSAHTTASKVKGSGDKRRPGDATPPNGKSEEDEEAEKDSRGRKKKASKRAYVHFRHSGTNIFIFRPRTTSISKEWMWFLFRALGGTIPRTLEISVPGLGARVRLPIPTDLPANAVGDHGYLSIDDREGEGYRLCTPSAVVEACLAKLRHVKEYDELLSDAEAAGRDIRLVWRRGRVLDWVEVGKREQEWGVVCGFALSQPHLEPRLELRIALHYPTTVRLPSTPSAPSIRLSEPPSIEGYLTRHRPKSNTTERIYLSSHDGHLFLCRPSSAHPPEPPLPVIEGIDNPAALVLRPFALGFASIALGEKKSKKERLMDRVGVSRIGGGVGVKEEKRKERTLKSLDGSRATSISGKGGDEVEDGTQIDLLETLEREEKKRAFQQISDARGFVDLRDVTSVELAVNEGEIDAAAGIFDIGGPEGLAVTEDKDLLVRQRSFVVTTKNGSSVRFEAHSIPVREEWVGRLRALVTYWNRRTRLDSIEQMTLTDFAARLHPTGNGSHARNDSPSRGDTDERETAGVLSKVYNWCVMDECRPVVRDGRFFVKKGLRGMFKERYLVLLAGTLIEYQVHQRDMHGKPLASVYHRRKTSLSLRGCYVYSGALTTSLLSDSASSSTWDPADTQGKFPRMYEGDGLRVKDDEEDCTLVIFKRPFGGSGRFGKQGTTRVLRARSMIERDQMVFALMQAIERLAEGEKEREDRLREFTWLK